MSSTLNSETRNVQHGLHSLFFPYHFSNTAGISVSNGHSYMHACLCYQNFRRYNLMRPGLNEIFCKCDRFINWHFITTFLLITLFFSFRLLIFKSTSFVVLVCLHFPCWSGPTCWRNWQRVECQLVNSKEMINIGSSICKWMIQSERHLSSFIQYRCSILKSLAT
jgi:hypothetical protein